MITSLTITPLDQRAFLSDWRDLYKQVAEPAFFLHPAWIENLIAVTTQGTTFYTIKAEAGQKTFLLGLIGKRIIRGRPPIGLTEARLNESANPAVDTIYIEYNDFLLADDAPPELRYSACLHLIDMIKVDRFVFRNVRAEMKEALERAASSSQWKLNVIQHGFSWACHLSNLRQEDKEITTILSKNTRSQLNRARKLYEQAGTLSVRAVSGNTPSAWQLLLELHEKTWQSRGQAGAFANANMLKFHRLLREAIPQHTELFEVRVGGAPIGMLYNFLQGKTVLNYQSGFSYNQDNRLKPGLLTHILAMQHYMEQGYEIYDMLLGDQRYKKSLGQPYEELTTIELQRPGLKNKMIQSISRLTS
ncbi:MAG: GNAT family N-acetyltransferase [bacterium]